ncbi:MAG: terminase small subunit [Clostridia bacterium]|nr:terminase small subunit [Clostridia bacterium]
MSRRKTTLDEKEELFCQFFTLSCSPRESAARAGYTSPEKTAIRLLSQEAVQKRLRTLFKENAKSCLNEQVIGGLKRLAFGSIADAVSLIFIEGDPSPRALEEMDLFCVSEIKRPREGALEIKFFDRLDALEKLAELSEKSDTESSVPFYQAIEQGARAIGIAGDTLGEE